MTTFRNLKRRVLAFVALLAMLAPAMRAGDVALKTNIVSDATLTPNLGIEFALAPHWSLDISGEFNNWSLDHGKRWKHWLAQPEARYWFCDRMAGHFLGFHLLGGQFNFGHIDMPFTFLGTDFKQLKDHRAQGWYGGAGIAYGYSWLLAKHWSLEAELGIGWAWMKYDKYECAGCGRKVQKNVVHNYVGPTKLAINLVYVF